MWIPQTIDLITRAVDRALGKRQGATDMTTAQVHTITKQMEQWSQLERPFSWAEYARIVPVLTEGASEKCIAAKSRRDVARELYEAAKENSEDTWRRWAGRSLAEHLGCPCSRVSFAVQTSR